MAIAPLASPATIASSPAAIEEAFLAGVGAVEHAVDAWLQHQDRTRPQAVPLPRGEIDTAAGLELARRYQAAGWGHAEIKDGVLHLTPSASAQEA